MVRQDLLISLLLMQSVSMLLQFCQSTYRRTDLILMKQASLLCMCHLICCKLLC